MAWADVLVVAPEDHGSFEAGDSVTVILLES
jgi:molybdopterin biosynthesis enzyme